MGSELAGIVGQGVEHEQRECLVGLHHRRGGHDMQGYALQAEGGLRPGDDVEHILHREALYMQVELSPLELDPLGEHLVVVVDMPCEFNHIAKALCVEFPVVWCLSDASHLVDHAVDIRNDVAHEEELGLVVDVLPLVAFGLQAGKRQLFVDVFGFLPLLFHFQQVVFLPSLERLQQPVDVFGPVCTSCHAAEDDQQEDGDDDEGQDGDDEGVELHGEPLQLFGPRLQGAVLSGHLLQVEVYVAVDVAVVFVVHGRIDQTEVFADACHEVGCLFDVLVVVKGFFKTDERRAVVAQFPIAKGERAVGSCRLIDIAIVLENVERTLGKITGQQTVGHVVAVDIADAQFVAVDEA